MKKLVLAIIRGAVISGMVATALSAPLSSSGARADEPPISGSVQNFTAYDEPVPAPDTPFSTENDGERTLVDFRGRVVVVNFWATWCGPCIRELPSLERLQAGLGSDRFQVALFSQDRDGWPRVNKFLKKLKIASPDSYLDVKLKFARAMGVRGLPVTAIIDAEGNELGRVSGAAEWDTPEAFALIQHYLDEIDGDAS